MACLLTGLPNRHDDWEGERTQWMEGNKRQTPPRQRFWRGEGYLLDQGGRGREEQTETPIMTGGGTSQKTPRTSSCAAGEARGRNGTTRAHVPQLLFFVPFCLSLLSVTPPLPSIDLVEAERWDECAWLYAAMNSHSPTGGREWYSLARPQGKPL